VAVDPRPRGQLDLEWRVGPIGQLTKSKENVPMNDVCERRRSFTRLLGPHADDFNSNPAQIRLEEPKASPDALLLGQLIR
jgi:hypothetical protein